MGDARPDTRGVNCLRNAVRTGIDSSSALSQSQGGTNEQPAQCGRSGFCPTLRTSLGTLSTGPRWPHHVCCSCPDAQFLPRRSQPYGASGQRAGSGAQRLDLECEFPSFRVAHDRIRNRAPPRGVSEPMRPGGLRVVGAKRHRTNVGRVVSCYGCHRPFR
jgi:hypothetical protein